MVNLFTPITPRVSLEVTPEVFEQSPDIVVPVSTDDNFNPLQVNVPSVTEQLFYGKTPGVGTEAPISVLEVPSDNYFVEARDNIPYPPEAPDWKLRGESAPMQVPEQPVAQGLNVAQAQPLVQEDPNKPSIGFNWQGVLDRVLSTMNDPEVNQRTREIARGVQDWAQMFGTSPFLSLADPENAVHRFQAQANRNAQIEAQRRRQQASPSSDIQLLGYLSSLGYSPEQALDYLMDLKSRGAQQINIGGGKEEEAFKKERGVSLAKTIEGMENSAASRERMSAYIDDAINYLTAHPEFAMGDLFSNSVNKTERALRNIFGANDAERERFYAALSNVSNMLRAENLKSILGGGQISNQEQEILTAMLPSEDKTREQNLYLMQNFKAISRILDERLSLIHDLESRGASASEIRSALYDRQQRDKKFFEDLRDGYNSLSEKGEGRPKTKSSFRVIGRVS